MIDGPRLGLATAGSAWVSRARARPRRERLFPSRLFSQEPPQLPPSGGGQGGPGSYPQQGGYAPPPYGPPPSAPPQGYPQYGPPSQGFPQGYPAGYSAPPPTPPRKKSNVGLIVGIVVAAVLVVCGGSLGLLYAVGKLAGDASAATPTVSGPTPTPTPTVIYADSLTAGATNMGGTQHCVSQSDGLHVHDAFACSAPAGTLTDVDVTVQVKQISGPTTEAYGIEVRRSSNGWYDFDIDGNSKFVILKCPSATVDCIRLVDFTASAAINGGLNTTNKLEVRAVGAHFDFYVNDTKVGAADDADFPAGQVELGSADKAEVVFTDLKITKPQAQ